MLLMALFFLRKLLIVIIVNDGIKMGLTNALQDITHSCQHWLCYCSYEVIIYNL